MSVTTVSCPGCGAPVKFLWSSAVQASCEFCKAIIVRKDVNVEKVGTVADLPADASPIQIGTEGAFGTKGFIVTGRIQYAYDQGSWNEWHLILSDGSSGWLSDAQAEYAVSFQAPAPDKLPKSGDLHPGTNLVWNKVWYNISSITRARYVGFQGELPFQTWQRPSEEEFVFADLRTSDARFATIDYSEDPPLLFIGQAVDFDDLRLKNLREFEGW
jgi:hypothetical protein